MEEATHMVNQIGLFSKNEDIEEISTADIKYLLLPALLGSVIIKCTFSNRNEILDIAEVYFKDYLNRCKDYGITEVAIPNSKEFSKVSSHSDTELIMRRQEKIARYKSQKEMEKKIDDLRISMEQLNVEEEIKREYYLLLIKKWIDISLEELSSIYNEKLILKQMPLSRDQKVNVTDEIPKKPLRPVIITRNQLQKKVYGLGYPSIPIMTVDEFYHQKYGQENRSTSGNSLQNMAQNPEAASREKEREEEEKERKMERDDADTLKKAREWDNWKDGKITLNFSGTGRDF